MAIFESVHLKAFNLFEDEPSYPGEPAHWTCRDPENVFNPSLKSSRKPYEYDIIDIEILEDRRYKDRHKYLFKPGITTFVKMYDRYTTYEDHFGLHMFCPECKEQSVPYITLKRYGEYNSSLKDYCVESMECPHCGHITEAKDIIDIWSNVSERYLMYEDVYDNEDKVSLVMTEGFASVTSKGAKLKLNTIKTRFTFNTKTGQSYFVYSKINGKRTKDGSIKNISYFSANNPYLSRETIMNAFHHIREKKGKLFGYKPLDFYSYTGYRECDISEQLMTVEILSNYNRLPNETYVFFDTLKYIRSLRKNIRHNVDDVVGELCRIQGIKPTKTIRKLLKKRPDCSDFIPFLQKHISSTDLIIKLAEDSTRFHFGEGNGQLFIDLIKEFGETIAVQKVLSYPLRYYNDAQVMYSLILEHGEEKPSLKGNMKEMHDRFMLQSRLIRSKGYGFIYKEEDIKKMDASYGDVKFQLALHSKELEKVGNHMSICVGSYSRRVVRKECHIVYATVNDNPVLCIELSSSKKKVMQCKARYNRQPEDELLEAALQWISDRKLKVSTEDIPSSRINDKGEVLCQIQ